ncbi:MAG: tetratricopeptide repeat protein [Acidobacteria bacterium]|uniref:Tetratricopeptide repeat protein n=1 Tax=Candidatus Sulfomarinibacter kjeldsenii TaxID=2885994 RepID=A0A8J7C3P2_9BACT|nr:tetratricopeptide repeat protein [Candidatus Sulfomarinibacter kjeldsenii]MBD3871175.1 tetratricopeptide repeat protein [Candidatus Sulfomarinibacter kjeldsenii]
MKSRVSRATIAGAAALLLLAAALPAHAEWNKGLEAYKKKDWADAVKEFEEVTKTNPDYAGAYYMLGVSQRALGQLSPAIASLRKSVELDGSQASYKIALGQALLQADQYQNAYELLKPLSMSSMDASHRSSYALLFAQAATKTNRPGEAIGVLTTQARADSRNYRLQQALGSAYTASGDEAKAFEAYKSAYDLNAKDATSARNAVKAAISVARRSSSNSSKSNYYNQAGQIADRLANASPTFEHQLLAGEAWLGAKQYQKAQASFDKARSQQSNNALVYYYIAQCKTQINQLNPALADLQQALKIGASGKLRNQIYNQGAFIYDKKKDYNNAISWYQEAGNQSMVRQMEDKKSKAAQNQAADKECADFKKTIAALRLQVDELQKIGDNDSAQQLLDQLPALEKDYSERCR